MDTANLLKLYPQAIKKNVPSSDPAILSLVVEEEFLWLEKETISEQETKLLKALFKDVTSSCQHPWYRFLFEKDDLKLAKPHRIFQIHLEMKEDFLKKEWQKTVTEMFPFSSDFFFYTEKDAILVEEKNTSFLDTEQLTGIFLSLDADFEVTSQVFVGSFHSPDQPFPEIFAEERKAFLTQRKNSRKESVFSLPDIALRYYIDHSLLQGPLVQSYQQVIRVTEMYEVIGELWKNQGNISSTAKALFLHRNTLKYRIEKFQESTGLNLQKTDDLLFCYLIYIQDHINHSMI